jgi:c-di-GMP-binding flagellar brake protein YcgR
MARDRDDAGAALETFAVERPGEVAGWLRQLGSRSIVLTLAAGDGPGVEATIRSVDLQRGRLVLDAAAVGAARAHLLRGDEVTAVATLDEVKVQFGLRGLTADADPSSTGIHARLPARLYRIQRRAAYRVRSAGPGSPLAEFRHPAIPEIQLVLEVLDLSVDGCALLLPPDVPAIAPGITINGARIRIGSEPPLDTALQVQHLTSIQPGEPGARLGCRFVGLAAAAARALQRHVDGVQRRGRAFGS